MRITRAFCLAALLAAPLSLHAQPKHLSEIIEAQMRPGWQSDSGTHIIALHLKLSPDWITYWRHPGESGIAPRFDWSGSRNLARARVHWPEPKLHISAGFLSIGYADELVLPIELTPERSGQPIELDGSVLIGVCADICIPVDLPLRLALSGPGKRDATILEALDRRPREARSAGLRGVDCDIAPDKRGLRLSAVLDLPQQGSREFVLVEPGAGALPSRALSTERNGASISGESLLQSGAGGIDRSAVRVSIVSENGMLEHRGCSIGN